MSRKVVFSASVSQLTKPNTKKKKKKKKKIKVLKLNYIHIYMHPMSAFHAIECHTPVQLNHS